MSPRINESLAIARYALLLRSHFDLPVYMFNIIGRNISLLLPLLLIVIFAASGCQPQQKTEAGATAKPAAFAIAKTFKRGPATLTLKVSKKEITIAEKLELHIVITIQEDYEVVLPEFGDKLERFGITNYQVHPRQLQDDGLVKLETTYTLEPFLSGDYEIPPMTVKFYQQAQKDKMHSVESEPLKITVQSLLPENTDLTLHEIEPPLTFTTELTHLQFAILAGFIGILVIGIIMFFWWRRRLQKTQVIVKPLASEIAFAALQSLLDEKQIEQGAIKTFYLQLSNILRHYIEDRFGLHAPERTTEEFLNDLATTNVLVTTHKNLIKAFLQHCDLVKFAEHQPATAEIQTTFDACKTFIVETKENTENSETSENRENHAP